MKSHARIVTTADEPPCYYLTEWNTRFRISPIFTDLHAFLTWFTAEKWYFPMTGPDAGVPTKEWDGIPLNPIREDVEGSPSAPQS